MNDFSAYIVPGLKSEFMPKKVVEPIKEFKKVLPKEVIKAVSDYLDIPIDKIIKKGRKRTIVYARKLSVYIIRENTDLSLNVVGEFFNDALTDHTSVLHCQTFIKKQISGKFINQEILYDIGAIMDILLGVETVKFNHSINNN